jgi:hypothetical protein
MAFATSDPAASVLFRSEMQQRNRYADDRGDQRGNGSKISSPRIVEGFEREVVDRDFSGFALLVLLAEPITDHLLAIFTPSRQPAAVVHVIADRPLTDSVQVGAQFVFQCGSAISRPSYQCIRR